MGKWFWVGNGKWFWVGNFYWVRVPIEDDDPDNFDVNWW